MLNHQINNAIRLLLTDRPIAYHPMLAKVCGGIHEALLLSQLLYWTPRCNDENGWVWKTQQDWEEETGLTRRMQESARRNLRRLGVIKEESKPLIHKNVARGLPALAGRGIAAHLLTIDSCLVSNSLR